MVVQSSGARVGSVAGDITITGTGGNGTSNFNPGVSLLSGGVVESTGTSKADAATITINGTGGDGTSDNYGVYVFGSGSRVSADAGDITIDGQGGNGSSGGNIGVYLLSGGVVESTGAGTITLVGTSADVSRETRPPRFF